MQVEDGTHIAENITSIAELKQKHSRVTLLTSLWLHGNSIERITDMNDFLYLVELDLSSNRIQKIEGLGMLSNLSCLNLASNKVCY
jgi:Leucine-rich repeat (LRR) protein